MILEEHSPGEEAVYEYIMCLAVDQAQKALMADTLAEVVAKYAEIEMDKLIRCETKAWEAIVKKYGPFPMAQKFKYYGLFVNVINEMCRFLEGYEVHFNRKPLNPLNGDGLIISYKEVCEALTISLPVAKKCISSLLRKGIVERKRGFGYGYVVQPAALREKMAQATSIWQPMENVDGEEWNAEWQFWEPIIEEAEKYFGPVQTMYEERLKMATKLTKTM